MLSESQAAFEIGLWGPSKARSFLSNLLSRFQGNATMMAAATGEAPIHNPTDAEVEANNQAALKEWDAPNPESIHEKAVNFIFAHNGCLSGDVKKAMVAQGATDNKWAYTLKTLGDDPRLRKEGERVHMRWFKA